MFLHQTTTKNLLLILLFSCILSCSYIKPQQSSGYSHFRNVVYYHVPTSNHNYSSNVILK